MTSLERNIGICVLNLILTPFLQAQLDSFGGIIHTNIQPSHPRKTIQILFPNLFYGEQKAITNRIFCNYYNCASGVMDLAAIRVGFQYKQWIIESGHIGSKDLSDQSLMVSKGLKIGNTLWLQSGVGIAYKRILGQFDKQLGIQPMMRIGCTYNSKQGGVWIYQTNRFLGFSEMGSKTIKDAQKTKLWASNIWQEDRIIWLGNSTHPLQPWASIIRNAETVFVEGGMVWLGEKQWRGIFAARSNESPITLTIVKEDNRWTAGLSFQWHQRLGWQGGLQANYFWR